MVTSTTRLRSLLAQPGLVVAGCFDALSARMAEVAGFEAAYVSGFAVEASQLGSPDVGVITRTEMATHAGRIASAVDIPLICDVDTGYGDVLNVARTIGEFERAGVAAVQIEDQPEPKRCPLVEDRTVLPLDQALRRLGAALEARTDPDFFIIARTDADELSFDDAVTRARAYVTAGADAVMSPLSGLVDGVPFRRLAPEDQMEWHRRFCAEVGGPVFGLSIPATCTATDMFAAGYHAMILPTLSFRAAAIAMMASLREARVDGTATEYFASQPDEEQAVGLGLLRMLGLEADLELRRRFEFDPRVHPKGSQPWEAR